MKILGIFFSLAIFFSHIANAKYPVYTQDDLVFVQFYSSPLYLNPAFAGSFGGSRAGFAYRDEWPAISGSVVRYHLFYDQYVHPVRGGGIGLNAYYDKGGYIYSWGGTRGAITNTYAGLIYSPVFIIKEKISIKPAIEIGYLRKEIDWNYFGKEIRHNFDLSTGIMVNSENLFGGVALHHLTQPEEGFIVQYLGRIPMKITLHVGYNYQKEKDSKFAISPNIIYQKQQNFRQINLGLYARYAPVVFGIWYRQVRRNSDAFIAMLGLQYEKFRIGYSYDITLFRLGNATAGSHEFTLGYLFNSKNKEDKIIPLKMIAF